jgi:hypothetical protein
MIKAARALKLWGIVHLGDFLDCHIMSTHPKKFGRPTVTMETEITVGNKLLNDLDSLGATLKQYYRGNHEDRIERQLAEHPQFSGLVDFEGSLQFKSRGWEVIQYNDYGNVGKMFFTHCVNGQAGINAFVAASKLFERSTGIGHVHRMATQYRGNLTGDTHVAASFGWLGDKKYADYMHNAARQNEWHLGFGIAYMQPSGIVHVHTIPIIESDGNYSCEINGSLYVG